MLSEEELEQKKLISSRENNGTWWSDFYLLPSEMHEGDLYVAVALHSHPPHDHRHWDLTYASAPTGSPPDFITRTAYEGAFPSNLRELIARALPSGEPTKVNARVYYELDPARFSKTSEKIRILSLVGHEGGVSMQPKSIEWNVNGAKHVRSITVSLTDDGRDGSRLAVMVRAAMDVKISETTQRDVDGQVWQELTSCLG